MERFQIVEVTEELNHAGTKATADIAEVADSLGFQRINVKMNTTVESVTGKIKRQIGYYHDWRKAEKNIAEGSMLLLQHPFHHKQLTRDNTLLKIKEKNVRIISVVHDVEKLRAFRYSDYYAHEFQIMLELADVIIVHNDVMRDWFIKTGVDERKLIPLGIFDYLQRESKEKEAELEKSITIAGNLDTTKCGYIGQLGKLKGLKVHLYGPNFDQKLKDSANIEYHGSFPVNEIPKHLNKGFGLVWDGESINGCIGQSGQYLRYNNPHKLSLYLSSGLPVIIWKEAAEASFVETNGVGLLIDSLDELSARLDTINIRDWKEMVEKTVLIADKLKKGFYAWNAINRAAEIIGQ